MLFLSQGKKVALIAISLFFVSLSTLFVLSEYGASSENHLNDNLFASFFSGHESSEGYESVLEKKSPIIVMTKSSEFVTLNESFSESFEYDKEDMKDQKFFSFFHSEDLPGFIGSFTKALQSKDSPEIFSGPFRFLAKSGDYHLVIVSIAHQKKFLILEFRDITESLENLHESDSGNSGAKSIKNLKDQEGSRIIVEKK